MQNMEQTNSEILELADAELETINGGNWFGNTVHWLVNALHGPGDVRRSTDHPN